MKRVKSLLIILVICLCSAFSACGNPTKFDLDFIVDDEVYATITTAGNATIEMPEDPEKEGYTFDGWYWDKDVWEEPFTANSLLDAPLSSDMKVYAKWTENHEHSYTEEIIAPTCTEQGYTLHTCSCGDNYKDTYTEKISHSMTEWVEITPASCNHLGLLKRYCEYNCGHIEYDDIDLLPHTEVIDEAVEPTFTQTGLTEGKHCSVCGKTLIEQQIVPKKQIAVTSVDGGSINGNNLFILTGKDTTLLQLQNSLTITNNCEWLLYRDSNHTDIITSKVTDILNNGDNVYYIKLKTDNTIPTTIKKFYTLTIHRSYEVSINFYNDQTLLKTDKIYTGNTYNTDYVPDLDGYTFNGWVDSYNNPFESHIIWETENYYVSKTKETYLVSFDKDGGASLFDTMPVTFNESFNFGTASKDNYTFLGWEYNGTLITDANGTGLTTWNIDAENIVVKARFEGHLYSVSLQTMVDDTTSSSAGNVAGAGTFNYNSPKTISATTNLGYDFIGWYEDDELVSENSTFNYTIPAKNVTLIAKWQTKDEMKDFIFNSTPTTCSITGLVIEKEELINLIIPNYITNINNIVFENCSNLETIIVDDENTIYESVNSNSIIEKNTDTLILGCKNTEIPNTILNIGNYAFSGCSELISINIPNTIITIGSCAFKGCINLNNIIIPNSVMTVESSAFANCSSLTELNIPNKNASIGDRLFAGCSSLESLTIPWRMTGYYFVFGRLFSPTEFENSHSIKQLVGFTYYNGVIQHDNYSMSDYYFPLSLSRVTITSGYISPYAFENCRFLSNITLQDGISGIGEYAFTSCTGITKITIPNSVSNIGRGALCGCSHLESLSIPFVGTSKESSSDVYLNMFGIIFGYVTYSTGYHTSGSKPSGAIIQHSETVYEKDGNTIILSKRTTTYYCYFIPETLKTININGNTIIGEFVFNNCSMLENIILSGEITEIKDYAFNNCSNITNVYYVGEENEWNNISIGQYNSDLTNATIIYNYNPNEE